MEIFDDFSYSMFIPTVLGMRKNATGTAMQRHRNSIISNFQNLQPEKNDKYSNKIEDEKVTF